MVGRVPKDTWARKRATDPNDFPRHPHREHYGTGSATSRSTWATSPAERWPTATSPGHIIEAEQDGHQVAREASPTMQQHH
mgnify:FL=1